jgi:hypothetical protein
MHKACTKDVRGSRKLTPEAATGAPALQNASARGQKELTIDKHCG